MAKDDFHVIAYQILSYLYQCLKRGEMVSLALLNAESTYFKANGQQLNQRYWAYIIYNLQRLGLIEGVVFDDIDNMPYPFPADLEGCLITSAGIEYLTDNAFLQKAKAFLKDTKAIVPFV